MATSDHVSCSDWVNEPTPVLCTSESTVVTEAHTSSPRYILMRMRPTRLPASQPKKLGACYALGQSAVLDGQQGSKVIAMQTHMLKEGCRCWVLEPQCQPLVEPNMPRPSSASIAVWWLKLIELRQHCKKNPRALPHMNDEQAMQVRFASPDLRPGQNAGPRAVIR